MKIRQIIWFASLLPVLILQSGCCTYSVWNDGVFDASNVPAQNPNLKLFEAKRRNDFLVVYNEYSARKETVRRRAYLLNENQERLNHLQAPQFLDFNTNWLAKLSPVPVYRSVTNAIPQQRLYAICLDDKSFTLYSSSNVTNLYHLPSYDDGIGVRERIAITPLTVTADAVIAAGVIAVLAAASYAGCDCEWPPCN